MEGEREKGGVGEGEIGREKGIKGGGRRDRRGWKKGERDPCTPIIYVYSTRQSFTRAYDQK